MSSSSPTESPSIDMRLASEWARGMFGVRPVASFAELRGRVLSGLEEEDFVPSDGQREAVELLLQPADGCVVASADDIEAWPNFMQAREQELATAVSKLAVEYLSLPIADRKPRRLELDDLCEPFPRLLERLSALAPGDDAERPDIGKLGQEVEQVVDLAFMSFALPARAQARLRQAQVEEWCFRKSSLSLAKRLRQLECGIANPVSDDIQFQMLRRQVKAPVPLFRVYIVGPPTMQDLRAISPWQPRGTKKRLGPVRSALLLFFFGLALVLAVIVGLLLLLTVVLVILVIVESFS